MNTIDFKPYVGGRGTTIDRTGLALIPTPPAQGRWQPVPHITLVDEMEKALKPHNMKVSH